MSSFNYPDFLQSSTSNIPNNQGNNNNQNQNQNLNSNQNHNHNFNTLLFNKLSSLEESSNDSQDLSDNLSNKSPTSGPLNNANEFLFTNLDSFNLPLELQGGIGTISSRRPSYAAESFTRSSAQQSSSFPLFNQPIPQSQVVPPQQQHQQQQPQSQFFKSPPQLPVSSPSATFFNNSKSSSTTSYSNNSSSFQNQSNQFPNLNHQLDQLNDNFSTNFNLNANYNDFQQRRPSQLVEFQSNYNYFPPPPNLQKQQPQQQQQQQQQGNSFLFNNPPPPLSMGNNPSFLLHQQQQQQQQQQSKGPSTNSKPTTNNNNNNSNQSVKLEHGLILKDQYIIASSDLKNLYLKTINYFQNPTLTNEILLEINKLLNNAIIIKLITFIKNLNNLTFNHKILCLVINKNGKFDLLSYPNNSNIFLQKNDLVIVDGDRGKDLVMIIEPLVNLNFAILFNFLKKLEHLKSLTILDGNNNNNNNGNNPSSKINGTHSTLLNASQIINSHSNEDNEFIITLPTKQVLRFATPKEIHKISGKFLEEKKAFITCFNKIKELNLQSNLSLINVEYQSDFKKLIFYYYANFKRIDFRGLIKELFKIYKTRIWLCAVLPYNKPELYVTNYKEEKKENDDSKDDDDKNYRPNDDDDNNNDDDDDLIPHEYELTNDQILNFSINEFDNLSLPNYFHSKNLLNLIKHLNNEIEGNFYGFNTNTVSINNSTNINPTTTAPAPAPAPITTTSTTSTNNNTTTTSTTTNTSINPKFDPFGDSQ
ncbi:PSP1 C-terminal conserved region-domain-containing protein [Scheffersomyces coipomensis]|uniref:PSP1 C-terminal conserved region-domain-containing protein n=1 Tax=Scheffersomyces coipomensis TaxID=1788519 RepID=UPI00315CCE1F